LLDYNSTTPIYMQIANWLETEILKGRFQIDEKVYSQYQLADMFQINPATAAKGLTLLSEQNILYDRRGLGKFVSKDAVNIIKEKRKNEVVTKLIKQLVIEARYLDMEEHKLLEMIKEIYRAEGEEET
jgi:GntR family transcriptional regulator